MEFRLPELGEGVYEAELVSWLVKPGDVVKHGQALMEVLTDKATMEVPAPFAGVIDGLAAQPGQQVKVGDVVLEYNPAEASGGRQPPESATQQRADAPRSLARVETAGAPDGRSRSAISAPIADGNGALVPQGANAPRSLAAVKAAPSVRFMARKLGVDLTRIHGSGPGGRILIDDLSGHVAPQRRPAPEAPRLDYGRPGTRIKLQGLRRIIAERMVQSKRTIPHYTYVDECDLTELVRLREGLRGSFDRAGVKLTYLAFVVKAVAAALREVPLVNATLDEQAGEIVLHDRYHIGVAVATPNGLMVPVVRDADRKDLVQIARDIERLSEEARTGKARLDDLRGGTFTVTSIGGIGGLFATPVINPLEVGILGVGKVVKRPVFDAAGNVQPADLAYLSLSFDHRVVDGAVGAVFGNAIIRQLQQPAALLVAGRI
jgi:pyruvate dehydrogenase E2 component (dihydrolipoamide acetyltransferase)/2-oxoisovalerate dehydrogenase E2 component (dihydrolipoyl transacylase)